MTCVSTMMPSGFWKATPSEHPGPELLVLQRTDAEKPWDASPADTASAGALTLLSEGRLDSEGNPIGVAATTSG